MRVEPKYELGLQSICSNFYLDFAAVGQFKSYVGFGVGLLIHKVSTLVTMSSTDYPDEKGFNFSEKASASSSDLATKPFWNVSVGTSYMLNDYISFDFIKYEYRNAGALSFNNVYYIDEKGPDALKYSSFSIHRFSTGITISI